MLSGSVAAARSLALEAGLLRLIALKEGGGFGGAILALSGAELWATVFVGEESRAEVATPDVDAC